MTRPDHPASSQETSIVPAGSDSLSELVEKDVGARNPSGFAASRLILLVAMAWSLFQLWIASPFQYQFDFLALNDTQTRAIHLSFAVFLTFLVCPAFNRSPRHYVPWLDWFFAILGGACAFYVFWEYQSLSLRPGLPTTVDLAVASLGVLLLLEATRRSLGLPLVIIAGLFLMYSFGGAWDGLPDILRHRGQSLEKVASHQWLSSEGVFGVALGVSSSIVFLFVLFGTLLEKAGAGNYFIKLAFALLGHFRGGPAKAAVVASGLTGMVSGSSIANVVMSGTFTIPLMRRVGFSREQAGAIETAAGVDGQIMPPVMGAAAFLMVEFIGIPYSEVIRHAFMPAVMSYLALLYIVHLEAMKLNLPILPRQHQRLLRHSLLRIGITVSSLFILAGIVYYGIGWVKHIFPDYSMEIIVSLAVASYIGLLSYAAKQPPLEKDDPNQPLLSVPDAIPVLKTGLHYIIPVALLIWCLMVEHLSPSLSAFWACSVLIMMLLTQRPLLFLMRSRVGPVRMEGTLRKMFGAGIKDLLQGLEMGARNMVGIGVATAAAGIVVGSVSLTGIGQVMTELVEMMAGDSFILVLCCTALISLVLGMGLPTTANYIVVSSLMAGVIQELARKHGVDLPLIAIHMFVFYFGVMADITPPVGLAAFAGAAIAGGDPIRTGVQAFIYSSRTLLLPFFFIFNTKLLLIGVNGWADGLFYFCVYLLAIMLISAATQGYFLVRSRWYEAVLLFVIATMLFLPRKWLGLVYSPYEYVAPMQVEQVVKEDLTMPDARLVMQVEGEDELGDLKRRYVVVPMEEGLTATERWKALGITMRKKGEVAIVRSLKLMGGAENAGINIGDTIVKVRRPLAQPPFYTTYFIAFPLLLGVVWLQWRRRKQPHAAPKKRRRSTQLIASE